MRLSCNEEESLIKEIRNVIKENKDATKKMDSCTIQILSRKPHLVLDQGFAIAIIYDQGDQTYAINCFIHVKGDKLFISSYWKRKLLEYKGHRPIFMLSKACLDEITKEVIYGLEKHKLL